jgi:16S rRNA (cytosine967-C5)-methyltransferase
MTRAQPTRFRALGATPRSLAADAVAKVLDGEVWSQTALSQVLSTPQGQQLDARDRGFVTELVYGTLRFAAPLEASLLRAADKPQRGLDPFLRGHLLVGAYQLQHMADTIPPHAAVNEAIDGVREKRAGLAGFANALLRRLGSAPHELLTPTSTIDAVADAYGVPRFLAHAVAALAPAETVAAIAAMSSRPTTYAVWMADGEPQFDGAAPAPHATVPGVFALPGGKVIDVDGYARGDWMVMDPGSVLCARSVAAQPGMTVVDVCAAPGSKTLLLARAVGPHGKVIAVEQNDKRAKRITENAARMGLSDRIDVVIGDALTVDLPAHADAVLVDAPCTGLGTTRRKPEIKLRRSLTDVDGNGALQRQLLMRALSAVKVGGTVVYSVCSPMPQEGRAIVDAAIAETGAVLMSATSLLPHKDDADAFFIGVLRR